MQKFKVFFLIVSFTSITCITHAQNTQWYKGNLHTHSFWSDGDDFPEMIMGWYKEHGYDFVVLSEHNILAEGEKWTNIKKYPHGSTALRKYLTEWGSDWVTLKVENGDTLVRLKTLAEYVPKFNEPGKFLIMTSEEVSDGYQGKPIHINASNIQSLIQPQGGNSVADVIQNNIDAILKQRKETGKIIIPHLNHPNFIWAVTAKDLIRITGERFFEVYNGHPAVNNYGDENRSGTEEMWDEINEAYINMQKPLLYGLAVDDAHNYFNLDSNHSNTGRGWIMVRSTDLRPESLLTAMEAGDFYASTGVSLKELKTNTKSIQVKVSPEEGIEYEFQVIDVEKGKTLQSVKGTSLHYSPIIKKKPAYVRVKITSNKLKTNPYRAGELECAWTQPVMLER